MTRQGTARSCRHCGKNVYRSYRIAARIAARLPDQARPYWHAQGGGYCITRSTRREYDAKRAASLNNPQEN